MIFPVIAGALRRRFVFGPPASIALPHELFSNEMRDLRWNTGVCRAAGETGFQSGMRVFGVPEILECYATARRSAAAREFKPGPRLAQTPQGSRKF
jgi:hypothetical protein